MKGKEKKVSQSVNANVRCSLAMLLGYISIWWQINMIKEKKYLWKFVLSLLHCNILFMHQITYQFSNTQVDVTSRATGPDDNELRPRMEEYCNSNN